MPTFIVPTRNRPDDLARTLAALGRLPAPDAEGSVVVIDNASDTPPVVPTTLANGLRVDLLLRDENEAAASRNAGAAIADPADGWLVMLDDDSNTVPGRRPITEMLAEQPADVGAVMADIHLAGTTPNRREAGGLPEVFIGCGVAIRAELFKELGGYDASFGYYAEEYDLAARILLNGRRIVFEPDFRVEHHKVQAGRDMNLIVQRLVRNNGWVAQRYAPVHRLADVLDETRTRYGAIARKENATDGYDRGIAELDATIAAQVRTPMSDDLWDRFTGKAAARRSIASAAEAKPLRTVSLVAAGKNESVIREALIEADIEIAEGLPGRAEALIIGTLSPGPMLDAAELLSVTGRRVIKPWSAGERVPAIA